MQTARVEGEETKERRSVTINLRATTHVRDMIDLAANVEGKNRSEFILESARLKAEHVLLDQKLFALDNDKYQKFIDVLENPLPPTDQIRQLLARDAPWERQRP